MPLETRPRQAIRTYRVERRHPRLLFAIPLTFHHLVAGGVRSSHGISLDISESGVGALVQGSLQVGATVAIDLLLPQKMSAVAIVRHSSATSTGFEFVGLTPEERLGIVTIAAQS